MDGDNQDLRLVPKYRFNFEVSLELGGELIPFRRVKSVNLPNISFETQTLNQYNIKRIVQTKMTYGACSIVFYDTLDNAFMNRVIKPYVANYYNTGLGLTDTSSITNDLGHNNPTVTSEQFDTIKGLYAIDNPEDKYFIPKIQVAQRHRADNSHSEKNRITTFKNCTITNIDTDALDYSDSEPCLFSVTFEIESMFVEDE